MKSHIRRPAALFGAASLTLGLTALVPDRAEACGGLFCANTPVVQVGEFIIFTVDEQTNTVEATINITYQGPAPDFAWVLPLQKNPDEIHVGSSQAFQVAQRLTAPRFQITEVETVGICGPESDFQARAADSNAPPAAPGLNNDEDGGVQVLQRAAVGPYDSVVLAGVDVNAVRRWLLDNNYNVTDDMMKLVVPYLAEGNVLLALKLRKTSDTGDIQPIHVKMIGDGARKLDACVPIKLTAIAAQADMQVTSIVLSNAGRTIPENYYHVVPNYARIDWLNRGANYNQLLSAAIDEGTGNAFTTEFAGPSSLFRDQIWVEGQIRVDELAQQNRINDFLQRAAQMGILGRSEFAGIMTRNIPAEVFTRLGIDPAQFTQCVGCFVGSFGDETFDAQVAANEVRERIEEPERKAQEMFDKFSYATRLNTTLDPEEMNIDPIFSFKPELPPVSNVHGARMILDCGVGGTPGSAGVKVVLEDGLTIAFDSNGNPDRTILDSMPAAARVEQLAQGLLVKDNTGEIASKLDDHNSRNGAGGCGCTADDRSSAAASSVALFGLIGLALIARRRRSRR